jgi:hypothetical protein
MDAARGKGAAALLHQSFSTTGILGHTEMPEDILPSGVAKSSLDHLLFITLTVSIDYQRDAAALWEASRKTFEDAQTRYLFSPQAMHETPRAKIIDDMQKYRLSQKPRKDADIWRTVGTTFHKKWIGDPRNFLDDCRWDAPTVLRRLKGDSHLFNQRAVADYPYLRGDKIGPLWLRMLRDNVGISTLRNLEDVPIPVDIHVARATLAEGVVRGQFEGGLASLFGYIRKAWFDSVRGLAVGDRPMIALDVDEPLWHLSRYGCTNRDKATGECPHFSRCEMRDFCIPGKVVIANGTVEVDT